MATEMMNLGRIAFCAEMLIAIMMKETYSIVWMRNLPQEQKRHKVDICNEKNEAPTC